MFLNEITQLSDIEWGKTHYWDVMFTTAVGYNNLLPPPFPFATWFPASAVEENLATISKMDIDTYISSFSIPQRTTQANIQLTFFDDANHTLAQWFTNWINTDMLNDGNSISPIKDIVRLLIFVKYTIVKGVKVPVVSTSVDPVKSANKARNILTDPLGNTGYGFQAYYVYPETTLNYQGTSDAGVPSYLINFMIAGNTGLSAVTSNRNKLAQQLAKGTPQAPPTQPSTRGLGTSTETRGRRP